MDDKQLRDNMNSLHNLIWQRFVHPEVHLIYDYIAPTNEKDRWKHLPTTEEIKASKPNVSGWRAGMEDCSINGGAYLAGLVDRYDVTHLTEHAEEARIIYKGLKTLGTVSSRKGFIARGVLPDGVSHYGNSSVDQYTLYIYGIWRYYHSSISTQEEKDDIKTIMNNICMRIEEDGFDILQEDGKPAQVSDIGVIRSDRSSRLLEVYLVGYNITRDKHWLDIYYDYDRMQVMVAL